MLWPGGEAAAASVRDTVLEAAGLLRRLGVDVRIRTPQPGTPQADGSRRWADTALLVDDAHDPAALSARVRALTATAGHVVVCVTGAGPSLPEEVSSALPAQVQVVAPNSPDGAALAAAWLPLTEGDTPADAASIGAEHDRPRPLFRPISTGGGAGCEHEGNEQSGDDADDHADGRVTQQ